MRVSKRFPVAAFVLLAAMSFDSIADSAGYVGRTQRQSTFAGCNDCHGTAFDPNMNVTLTGPTALSKGATGTYILTASKTGVPNGTPMGLNVASSDVGSLGLIGGQPTKIVAGDELTHMTPNRTTTSTVANYQFTYTMPAGAAVGSTHTLYAIAVIDYTGGWRHASNLAVFTRPVAPTSVSSSALTPGSVNLTWTGTGPEYRVVYKPGAVAPISESDGIASDHGTNTSATIVGFSGSTQYSIAVFSKLSGQAVFSSTAATTTITTPAASAAARYVNAGTGSNVGVCNNPGSPCKTITYAMAQAVPGSPGDAVNVAPGTYNQALGEVFPILVRSGVQLRGSGSSPGAHVIDATGANARVLQTSGNSFTVIERFIITGGFHQPAADGVSTGEGGGILVQGGGSPQIRRNLFIDNEARGWNGDLATYPDGGDAYGGAIASRGSAPTLENNLFYSNTARGGDGAVGSDGAAGGGGHGGAVYIGLGGSAMVFYNSFVANEARGGTGSASNTDGGIGGFAYNGGMESFGTTNASNLFVNNAAIAGAGGAGSPTGLNGTSYNGALDDHGTTAQYSLFFNNSADNNGDTVGLNPVLADPQFFSSTDFRIRLSSPARGAGFNPGPAIDYNGVARPPSATIGAFEATGLPTVTGLVSSVNPSAIGQSVTFTATASSVFGPPTGTVTFKDGATPICTSVPLAATQAQCVTSSLTAATHSITAEYTASGNFASSISAPLSQEVTPDPARLGNISTRGQVLTGNDVMIGGFVIGGSANKTVVVRARGPSLVPFGITNALANPHLQLVRSSDQATLVVNDDWGQASNAAAITASGFAPSNSLESAILINLPPGAYTAILSGVGGGTGVGIIEVFEVDHAEIPLVNISTRGRVFTGNDVMIGGFVIQGSFSQTVVVRARGPSLVPFGITNALMNPQLQLVRSSDQATLEVNDDWGSAGNAAALSASGFAPSDSREAAILITLPPGAYTAIVSGVAGSTGVAIMEVFAQ